jgi:hypothetical protein
VGGLGHILERDGLATTQISLVREHTAVMKPPRALWVPFEFGRPLGEPGDAAFQHRVLIAALELLDAPRGPVLADFPDDAPGAVDVEGWACPINLKPPARDMTETEALREAMAAEIAQLAPWYDMAVEKLGRTTVGPSEMVVPDAARFVGAFLESTPEENPRPEMPITEALRLASDDVKAYCLLAAAAQPGAASSSQLLHWFWDETVTGRVFLALRDLCLASADPDMKDLGRFVLAPPSRRGGLGARVPPMGFGTPPTDGNPAPRKAGEARRSIAVVARIASP